MSPAKNNPGAISSILRIKVFIRGAVQGVGFRPFVYRLATEMNLTGWVSNTAQGVFIEAEGTKRALDEFVLRLQREKPPRAFIQSLEFSFLDPLGFSSFTIRESEEAGAKTVLVLPDIATCPDCLGEIFDPADRRYLYPFTNCTNCGPRFSIIERLPYDRRFTSMRIFSMCPDCQREYEDPLDRRFHAQPNACPSCGPHLELWDAQGQVLARDGGAIAAATNAVRQGEVVAVKGLGGFHLVVDARSESAVMRLREKKHREEKPFALMFPSIESVEAVCTVSEFEKRLLLSPESPIVLLERKSRDTSANQQTSTPNIAPSIAPRNPYFGIMLPYAPLHHILLRDLGFPVVATSGNLSDEPICTDEQEAVKRLVGVADLFLVHNRPIVRHVDDSIVRVILGRGLVVRRARGYAPLPVPLNTQLDAPVLAVGGHLKNTVALAIGDQAFISQHIGDLETHQSLVAFRRATADLQALYEATPVAVVCDMHPDYISSQDARRMNAPLTEIQHHYAHVAACMAENELDGEVLGVSWDGTGFGFDGTIWGGEFLLARDGSFERVATFRPFRLPGGEKAIKEPRRTALGALYEVFGDAVFHEPDLSLCKGFDAQEIDIIHKMIQKGLNSPLTFSVGRLFDAVASVIGLRHLVNFEGQAAMELEFAMAGDKTDEAYGFAVSELQLPAAGRQESNHRSTLAVDWSDTFRQIRGDLLRGVPLSRISTRFHNMLIEALLEVADRVGVERIVLTGGCFQNRYLTEQAVQRLRAKGLRPYWHQRVPPNDGGIALGQIYAWALAKWHRNRASAGSYQEAMG